MPRIASGFVVGLIFGLGLTISQMINPAKVIGFLDLAGAWDPSLALVMIGALVVTGIGYRLTLARQRPVLAEQFQVPARQDLDARLLGGSGVFGVGWGLAGLCPGPAIAALGLGKPEVALFVVAMAVGLASPHWLMRLRSA